MNFINTILDMKKSEVNPFRIIENNEAQLEREPIGEQNGVAIYNVDDAFPDTDCVDVMKMVLVSSDEHNVFTPLFHDPSKSLSEEIEFTLEELDDPKCEAAPEVLGRYLGRN